MFSLKESEQLAKDINCYLGPVDFNQPLPEDPNDALIQHVMFLDLPVTFQITTEKIREGSFHLEAFLVPANLAVRSSRLAICALTGFLVNWFRLRGKIISVIVQGPNGGGYSFRPGVGWDDVIVTPVIEPD